MDIEMSYFTNSYLAMRNSIHTENTDADACPFKL